MKINMKEEKNAAMIKAGQALVLRADALKKGVCEADDNAKKKYYASLKANKAALSKVIPANFEPSEEDSGSQDAI
jgi:hypothetical protein